MNEQPVLGDVHIEGRAEGTGRVYQVGQGTLVVNDYGTPLRAASVVLPVRPSYTEDAGVFVGRDRELAALSEFLDPVHRSRRMPVVLAIAGLAGVGKTALARHAAGLAVSREWFDVAVFTDLHGYDPDPQARVLPAHLFASLLRCLGVEGDRIPAASTEQATMYHHVLAAMAERNEPVLLLFDNVASPSQLLDLLPQGEPHRALVTSRHTLGELDGVQLLELDVLTEDEAVSLLAEGLRQRSPSDLRVSDAPANARTLARLCDCLPLALRITAALLAEDATLPVADLVHDLTTAESRLDGLAYGERAVSNAFDLSWQCLLDRDARAARLFLLLPLNPGPEISGEAAAALHDQSALMTRRLLRVLRQAHLIEPGSSHNRWRMHDVVRLYARGLAEAQVPPDQSAAALDRLLRYYLVTAEAAKARVLALPGAGSVRFPCRDGALDWLDVERPNLVAAVLLAATSMRYEIAVDLSLALSAFLRLRRHFDDYVVTAVAGLRAAGLLGDRGREAMAVTNLGFAPRDERLLDDVIESRRQTYQARRDGGDSSGAAWALTDLGAALWASRRYDEVVGVAREASTVFGELGDRHHQGWALSMLGLALQKTARITEAVEAQEQACSIFREISDDNGEAWSLTNLGAALRDAHRFDEAIEAGRRAHRMFQAAGDRTGQGATLVNLAGALAGLRRLDEAVAAYRQSCVIFAEVGDRQREATALTKLGSALREMGNLAEAIDAEERAYATFQGIGDRYGEALSLTELGHALTAASAIHRGRDRWERAVELFHDIGADDELAKVRRLLRENKE